MSKEAPAFPFLETLVSISEQMRSADKACIKAGRRIKGSIITLSGKILLKYPEFPERIDVLDTTNSARAATNRYIIVFKAVSGQLMMVNRTVGIEEDTEGLPDDQRSIEWLPRDKQTDADIRPLNLSEWNDYGKLVVRAISNSVEDLDRERAKDGSSFKSPR